MCCGPIPMVKFCLSFENTFTSDSWHLMTIKFFKFDYQIFNNTSHKSKLTTRNPYSYCYDIYSHRKIASMASRKKQRIDSLTSNTMEDVELHARHWAQNVVVFPDSTLHVYGCDESLPKRALHTCCVSFPTFLSLFVASMRLVQNWFRQRCCDSWKQMHLAKFVDQCDLAIVRHR